MDDFTRLAIAAFSLSSALLTATICSRASILGRAARLVSTPDGIRRLHKNETPLIGGIAVLLPVFLASLVYSAIQPLSLPMQGVIISSAVMLIVGVLDDRLGISPVWRLVALSFITFGLFSAEPIFILHSVKIWLFHKRHMISFDPFAGPVTAFMIIGFVNAANMADGINGQLLGSVLFWSMLLVLHLGLPDAAPFVFLMCSAAVVLYFNLTDRLFSGSAGAYALSMLVALAIIATYKESSSLNAEIPLYWIWLPVLDCLRLALFRLCERRSPFSGDRNHIHHLLLDIVPARYALVVYLIFLAIPGAISEFSEHWTKVSLPCCVLVYSVFVGWRITARAGSSGLRQSKTNNLPAAAE